MINLKDWLPVMISLTVMICTVITFFRASKKTTGDDAAERAKMSADITHIRLTVDEIKADRRADQADIKALETRVAKVEASAQSAHKRLDDFRKEILHEHD